jgi:hypothetical protein
LQIFNEGDDTATVSPVAEWTTTETPYPVALANGTYILHEKTAPAGYLLAEDVVFEEVGEPISHVYMLDERAYVEVIKQDEATKRNLGGAHLQIFAEGADTKKTPRYMNGRQRRYQRSSMTLNQASTFCTKRQPL